MQQSPREAELPIRAAVPAREWRWLRAFDSPRLPRFVLAMGIALSLLAGLLSKVEEEREERSLLEISAAPYLNAVERELGKYDSLEAVAQLTSDPLSSARGEGIKTYLLGEALERLYPAVSYVAFVRSVASDQLAAYERNAGAGLSFDEGGVPAWRKPVTETRQRHYIIENISPASAIRAGVAADLGDYPALVKDFERAEKSGAFLSAANGPKSLFDGPFVVAPVMQGANPLRSALREQASRPLASRQRSNLAQPAGGFLIVGLNFQRLMDDALRELPADWRARLHILHDPTDAATAGDVMLFDNWVGKDGAFTTTDPGVDPIPIRPGDFRLWGRVLRLELIGHESVNPFLFELMPIAVLLGCLMLTLVMYMVARRIQEARRTVRVLSREAEASTRRFRDIVETSSDWIWELDDELRFTYLSPTTETLLGYRPEELLGRSARSLLAAGQVAAGSGLFPVTDGELKPYTGFERCLRHKNGDEIVVESAGTPIVDNAGKVTGYRGIDRDVTQQRQFRERLSQLHEDLARHMQTNLAGQLLSGLAHELNQPLSAILTYNQACLRLLKSGNADPADISAAMQSTADNVLHARDILQRLRRFTARREPRAVATPLAPLVQNCLGLIEIRLRSLEVETHIDIAESLPWVMADPILAAQVFLNVFNNAIDAMRQSAQRRISVRAGLITGRNVQVRIEDSGPGISAENLPRLFETYFTTKPEGTGIGLPLCRSIIEAMGGSIKVSSEPGHGAVVDLEFPVAPPDQARDEGGDDASSADRLAA